MRQRLILPIVALAAILAGLFAVGTGDAQAKSRYTLGMGDQEFHMFANPDFQRLNLKKVRIIIPWNYRTDRRADKPSFDAWLAAARSSRKQVLVAFGAARGCYNNGRYSRTKRCRAPSVRAFTRELRAFRRANPTVRTIQPWNEVNNKSQPTYRKPGLAAKYYIAAKRTCRSCTVVAADMLDTSDMLRYVTRVKKRIDKAARRQKFLRPRIWGLHNYGDVNRKRTRQTRAFLRRVPGQVWLTETGGLVKFLPTFRNSPRRAADRTRYMFRLADRFSRKRSGQRSRITRVYPYKFFGYRVAPGERNRQPRFDSGLVGPLLLDASFNPGPGSAVKRPAYRVFQRLARTRSK